MSYNIAHARRRLESLLSRLNLVIVTLIMIGRLTPDPHSMKTTPRLFEKRGKSPALVAVFIEGGGHNQTYQERAKDCYSSVPPGPSLEWVGSFDFEILGVCN